MNIQQTAQFIVGFILLIVWGNLLWTNCFLEVLTVSFHVITIILWCFLCISWLFLLYYRLIHRRRCCLMCIINHTRCVFDNDNNPSASSTYSDNTDWYNTQTIDDNNKKH